VTQCSRPHWVKFETEDIAMADIPQMDTRRTEPTCATPWGTQIHRAFGAARASVESALLVSG
jgi:hypothetical protein